MAGPVSPTTSPPRTPVPSAPTDGLLAVAAALRTGPDLEPTLRAVAASVSSSLEFATVTINLYRPAFHHFETVVVHGDARARELLLGTRSTAEEWALLTDERFERNGAYFLRAGEFDWDSEINVSYVPEIAASDDPDAWQADDALFVPLRSSAGVMLGVMSVDEPLSGRRPTDADLDVLSAVAAQAGLVIESAQRAEQASRHRADVQELLRVSSRLTVERSRTGIAQAVCEGIRDALGFERVCFGLVGDGGDLSLAASVGWGDVDMLTGRWTLADLGTVLDQQQEGCVLLSREEAHRHVSARLREIYSSTRNGRGPHAWDHHYLLVPLHAADGGLIGVIWADDPEDHLLPTPERLGTLRAFANQAASAFVAADQRERLRHLAEHDPLTGLRNRRGLNDDIDAAIAAAAPEPLAVVVADADAFKRINDELGYESGDRVLAAIADAIRRTLPPGAIGARLGGEEFALVLPRTDETNARLIAEALRRDVAGTVAVPWGLTLSAGVAATAGSIEDADALLRSAARALHAAKRLGRDRVVVYDPSRLERVLERLDRQDGRASHHLSAVLLLAETLDLRDAGTARHSQTVGRYAEAIAHRLDFHADRIERMRIAGILHDIGKLAVADAVLHKPGALTAAEWEEIRRHPEVGARILLHAGLPDEADWVLAHHERWDGGGYPSGLAGAAIPIEARVLAVADSYEAMTAARPYRPAPLTPEQACAELRRCSGTQFDPNVVEAFLEVLAGDGA